MIKFIYGIGVSNMKTGDAAYFYAVRTLKDAGMRLKGDVILAFVVDELRGGVGTLALIVRADYFVNSEPPDLAAVTKRAAAFTFVIELIGTTRHTLADVHTTSGMSGVSVRLQPVA